MIEKLARKPQWACRPTFFYDSARDGMGDFLRNFKTGQEIKILMPDWIGWSAREGSGVMDPVRSRAAKADFYRTNADLTADLSDIRGLLEEGSYDLVLVIHYFGRTDPQLEEIAQVTSSHGALLIEDLAHAMLSEIRGSKAGRYGQVCLYALHKLLPMHIGGAVRYSSADLIAEQMHLNGAVAAAALQFDCQKIASARRETFKALTGQLETSRECGELFSPIWRELGETDVPQTLPLFVETGERDRVYASMNVRGVGAVSLYHTLIEEVSRTRPSAVAMSKRIINLPVHQDIRPEDVPVVAKTFLTALRETL